MVDLTGRDFLKLLDYTPEGNSLSSASRRTAQEREESRIEGWKTAASGKFHGQKYCSDF